MFSQIWRKISDAQRYQSTDWVLKVEVDAIFMPIRMRVWFKQDVLVPPAGIYLENFKYVDYGYFGNFEFLIRQALSTFVDSITSCKTNLNRNM